MPRWLRVIRGMIGTGLTFAVGVGIVASVVSAVVWLSGGISRLAILQIAARASVVAFILGVAFSGILAITARSRKFSKLSLRLGSALGAGAGLLYFLFLAMNGGRNWSSRDAIVNFVLLTVMGAVSAAATLTIARKSGAALESGGELESLSEGDASTLRSQRASKVKVPRR
jgi:uncharacterized integral membrane protein